MACGSLFSKSGRVPVGLLLPRVKNAKDIHKLYSPKSRLTEFHTGRLAFLVRAAPTQLGIWRYSCHGHA